MNSTLKTHLISAAISFVAGFCGTLALLLKEGNLTPDTVTIPVILGLVFTAARAAAKPAGEILVPAIINRYWKG